MAGAVIAGAFALLLAGIYLGVRMSRPGVERRRSAMPGRMVSLSQGLTHVQWHGRDDAPVLVCVHGLSTASFVWGPLLPFLTGLGYRVLTYDLYGRGFSDRVRGRQSQAFFLTQLQDLLKAEGVTGRVTLMGYSMGGAISAAFAAAHPGRVGRLILLAPAGLGLTLGRFSDFVTRAPVIGDWMIEVLGAGVLRRSYRGDGPVDPVADAITGRALDELTVAGTLRAILSAQRGILGDDQSGLHDGLADGPLPILAIWGGSDTVIPTASRDRLAGINPSVRNVTCSDAHHGLPYTHPERLAQEIGPPV